jgi:translation initiation factor 1 (eIF-1/SUI1)
LSVPCGNAKVLQHGRTKTRVSPSLSRVTIIPAYEIRLVWTSDPEAAKRLREEGAIDARADQEPAKQTIRVVVDRKRRAGKSVTVASGFQLTAASLAELAAALKKRCGAGGTAGFPSAAGT